MPEWWEQPYNGGPMVPVPGFPRIMYPPDHAEGRVSDGPDVVAYKRTVSRCGRWPWQSFDDSYSNGFAHGNGPNVINTGVAGVQRQQNKPDDGVIDEKMFNTLRSIRVPEGKPHAGEMAMDPYSANLIAEAFRIYNPPPAPKETTRERALEGAIGWLGYTESPAGSNNSAFGSWYGLNYQPWCAMAISYWHEVEAGGSPSFERGSRYSFVPYVVSDASLLRNGLSLTSSPIPGDLACYDWQGDGTFDHIGLFEAGTPASFTAIEGNTSTSSDSNGGAVMRRSRSSSTANIVFVRVQEP